MAHGKLGHQEEICTELWPLEACLTLNGGSLSTYDVVALFSRSPAFDCILPPYGDDASCETGIRSSPFVQRLLIVQ
jgi:hypothetical protein